MTRCSEFVFSLPAENFDGYFRPFATAPCTDTVDGNGPRKCRVRCVHQGQLGDVMKESAQAAMSLLKTRAVAMGIEPMLFATTDVHVHVPAGATPKDGPSVGVAMFMALASLMTDRPIPPTTAMTGESSLRGVVLPVGGIREKVIAAARAGIETVMLPARNRRDFDDIPPSARERLRFVWLDTVDDALSESHRARALSEPSGSKVVLYLIDEEQLNPSEPTRFGRMLL